MVKNIQELTTFNKMEKLLVLIALVNNKGFPMPETYGTTMKTKSFIDISKMVTMSYSIVSQPFTRQV